MLEKINANSAFNPIKVDLFYYPKLFHTAVFLQQVSELHVILLFIYLHLSKQNYDDKLKNAIEKMEFM